MEPTNEALILLLSRMFYGNGRELLKRIEHPSVPATRELVYEGADLMYIELNDGDFLNGGSTIRVYRVEQRGPIRVIGAAWRMRIDRWIEEPVWDKIKDHITEKKLAGFLNKARMKGAERAVAVLSRNPAKASIFDVEKFEEVIVLQDEKGRPHEYGKLEYTESIDNSMSRFGGGEEVKLVRGARSETLVTTYVQGGRYRPKTR